MNISKEKNPQVFSISLDPVEEKTNLIEPALIQISWLTRIFGCRHKKLGSPFTRGNRTYNTCMICGACQEFDVKLWKNTGPFFYNPVLDLYNSPKEKTYKTSQLVSSLGFNKGAEDGGRNFELSENKDKCQE